jgi:hypothetical protein
MEEHMDIGYDEAKAILDSPEWRVGTAWYGDVAEVLHEGKWKRICRTDWKDDVCTGLPLKPDCIPKESYTLETMREKARGMLRKKSDWIPAAARVDDERFAIIDAFSDG